MHKTACFAAAGLFAAAAIAATAQIPGQGGFQGQRGERGQQRMQRQRGFGGQLGRGNGQFGRGGMMGGPFGMARMGGTDRNPLSSHVYTLIQRPDVQSEISLDLRQKNALAQYQTQMPMQMRQQMQQQMQGLRRGRGQGPDQGGAQGGEDRRQQIEQTREQIQSQVQTQIGRGLAEILKPEQIARLHQLDLQWRGVLSIADPVVAREVNATNEERAAIAALATEYQNQTRELRRQMMENVRAERQAAANANPSNPNLGIRQDPMIALERADAAARKEIEEKALKQLSPELKASWTKAQGRVFPFRSDIRTPRR